MSKRNKLPEKKQVKPIEEIRILHSEISLSMKTNLDKAIRIGELLVTEKGNTGYGNWQYFCMDNIPEISFRTIQRYMELYQNKGLLESKNDTMSYLTVNSAYDIIKEQKAIDKLNSEYANKEYLEKVNPKNTSFVREIQRIDGVLVAITSGGGHTPLTMLKEKYVEKDEFTGNEKDFIEKDGKVYANTYTEKGFVEVKNVKLPFGNQKELPVTVSILTSDLVEKEITITREIYNESRVDESKCKNCKLAYSGHPIVVSGGETEGEKLCIKDFLRHKLIKKEELNNDGCGNGEPEPEEVDRSVVGKLIAILDSDDYTDYKKMLLIDDNMLSLKSVIEGPENIFFVNFYNAILFKKALLSDYHINVIVKEFRVFLGMLIKGE